MHLRLIVGRAVALCGSFVQSRVRSFEKVVDVADSSVDFGDGSYRWPRTESMRLHREDAVANLHTPPPGNPGERSFFERVNALLGDDAHVWTELNSHTLGSGVECDQLLVARNLGAFAIEVKAIALDQIEEMGPQTCRIR